MVARWRSGARVTQNPSMIRHCSLWKFTTDAPTDLLERLDDAYRTAHAEIPSIRACQVGGNVGYLANNYDYALTIDFDDLDGYREYVAHDLHVQIFRELLEPHLDNRVAVQFELRG
jgi:hypothetical protein